MNSGRKLPRKPRSIPDREGLTGGRSVVVGSDLRSIIDLAGTTRMLVLVADSCVEVCTLCSLVGFSSSLDNTPFDAVVGRLNESKNLFADSPGVMPALVSGVDSPVRSRSLRDVVSDKVAVSSLRRLAG